LAELWVDNDDISRPSATDVLKDFTAFPVGQQLDVLREAFHDIVDYKFDQLGD